MTQELEQLKQLVLEGGFDAESRGYVEDLQKRVQKTIVTENLLRNTVIAEVVTYLETEVKRCTSLLAHDRKLSELQREVLFEKRDMHNQLLALFGANDTVKLIEHEIKSLLDVAKNQSQA